MEFDGLVASVSTGKVDMVVAGMTATDARKQSVDFSDPYYVASQVIVVAPDNTDITSAEDLKNDKTVGVVLGYTGDNIVTNDLQLAEDKVTRANRGIDIVQDVKTHRHLKQKNMQSQLRRVTQNFLTRLTKHFQK